MKFRTNLERKPTFSDIKEYEVAEIIEVSPSQFDCLMTNPLKDSGHMELYNERLINGDFDHIENPGLLIICKDRDDGILIDTQGYGYARYASVIPHANDIFKAQSMGDPLTEFCNDMLDIKDYILYEGLYKMTNGSYTVSQNQAPFDFESIKKHSNLLVNMLFEHEEVIDVGFENNELIIQYDPRFCHNTNVENPEHSESHENTERLDEPTDQGMNMEL